MVFMSPRRVMNIAPSTAFIIKHHISGFLVSAAFITKGFRCIHDSSNYVSSFWFSCITFFVHIQHIISVINYLDIIYGFVRFSKDFIFCQHLL